MEIKRHH